MGCAFIAHAKTYPHTLYSMRNISFRILHVPIRAYETLYMYSKQYLI